MYEFKDLQRLTLVASLLVGTQALLEFAGSAAALIQGPALAGEIRSAEWLQIASAILLLACIATVGRWIYLASSNAHAFGPDMTITPGWAVGWYFVPFANLVKPFQAMREIWHASHESSGAYDERVPILGVWWGLWITSNILSNVAWRLGDSSPAAAIDMVAAVLSLALAVVFIIIMRDVDESQRYVRHAIAFA